MIEASGASAAYLVSLGGGVLALAAAPATRARSRPRRRSDSDAVELDAAVDRLQPVRSDGAGVPGRSHIGQA